MGLILGGSMTKIISPDYNGEDRRSGDLPWWVRSIAIIGIPGAIAIFLVWVGSQEVPKIKAQGSETQAVALTNQKMIDELKKKQDAMFRMLQRICSNTARTEYDRQRCFDE